MKFYTLLAESEVAAINDSALEVLEQTGFSIRDREALEIFKKAGAEIIKKKEITKIPREIVLNAIKTMPKKLTLYGKKSSRVNLGEGNVYFMNGYGSVNVFDWQTRTRRPNTKKDLENFCRVMDKMENDSVYYNEVTPQEIDASVLDRHNAQVVLEFNEKPSFLEIYSVEGARDIFRMIETISGPEWKSKPICAFQLCGITPLLLDNLRAQLLMEVARIGMPVIFGTLPQMCGTSPATLAGTVVVQTAETLGALTLTQLINPGVPFILNNFAAAMDQKYGVFASGGPEMSLMQGATAQICRFYGMPQIGTSGSTESNFFDIQAGYEKSMSTLFAALAGVELIHGAVSGWVQSVLSHSLAAAVVSNEICGYVKRILEGVKVNKDTLAVDVIKDIGPGGNFLMHSHTMKYFRSEIWEPKIARRLTPSEWENQGMKGVMDYAQEQVDRILSEDPVSYISADAKNEIAEIVEKADKDYAKK
ncbi:MAG: trimethylamine methyltransferase family protein [Actinobacteria bacterium]|nr:trimethylamine methyltransferase family protein [Actinomycetota bacterium]